MPEAEVGAPAFGGYVAIDWSGAKGAYDGVAVARCAPGTAVPELVAPPAGARRWTRQAVLDWLLDAFARGPRLLVGFDFAFALPDTGLPLDRQWAEVEARCAGEPDLLGLRYLDGDPRFWRAGPRPAGWRERARTTEQACVAAGLGQPQSPLKLIGAKQVGKGALAGMRLLHRLHPAAAVWPLDDAGPALGQRPVCVEIYPRLFIRKTLNTNDKIRDHGRLDEALRGLGSAPGNGCGALADHAADALVSAAGLRAIAADPLCWQRPPGSAEEGWIFGVPAAPPG